MLYTSDYNGEEHGNSGLVLFANLFTPEQIAQIEPEKVTKSLR